MRDTAFIVCEYDPFHNGHNFHLRQTRRSGAERVICIMSGNFVQRGGMAFCDKFTRAKFAVDHGADLVLELPVKFAVSGAGNFALGAVSVIKDTGVCGTLSFGGSARVDELKRLADFINTDRVRELASEYSLLHGTNYAMSLQHVAEKELPQLADILTDANNVLALEYILKAEQLGLDADYYCVHRSVAHDSTHTAENVCSAKTIRDHFFTAGNLDSVSTFMPDDVYDTLRPMAEKGDLPLDKKVYSVMAMARLTQLKAADFREVNGVNQGLENRIAYSLLENADVYSLYDAVKTKRFTHSRVRQIITSAVLGIKKQALERPQPYVRVLGMNDTGRKIIKEMREACPVPVVMNLSEAPPGEERELDALCGKLFDICRAVPRNENTEYTQKPYVSS